MNRIWRAEKEPEGDGFLFPRAGPAPLIWADCARSIFPPPRLPGRLGRPVDTRGSGGGRCSAIGQPSPLAVNVLASFVIITVIFALLYKIIPQKKVLWHDVWLGAAVTSMLFSIGKQLIGIYLGRSVTVTAFGAVGSLAVFLLWVYYSAQIFLLGADRGGDDLHHGARSPRAADELWRTPANTEQNQKETVDGKPTRGMGRGKVVLAASVGVLTLMAIVIGLFTGVAGRPDTASSAAQPAKPRTESSPPQSSPVTSSMPAAPHSGEMARQPTDVAESKVVSGTDKVGGSVPVNRGSGKDFGLAGGSSANGVLLSRGLIPKRKLTSVAAGAAACAKADAETNSIAELPGR